MDFLVLCGHLLWRAVRDLLRFDVDVAMTIRQFDQLCSKALPLVLVGSALIGGVVAMQGLSYVARYNATEVYGWAAGLSALREVGPLLLSLTLAARLGTRNTAELAAMRVKEKITALEVLGVDVVKTLILPRFYSIFLAHIVFFPLSVFLIVLSSFVLAYVVGGQNMWISLYSMQNYLSSTIFLEGLWRLFCFGLITATVSTTAGNQAQQPNTQPNTQQESGAAIVGKAIYRCAVYSIMAIVLVNVLLAFATPRIS